MKHFYVVLTLLLISAAVPAFTQTFDTEMVTVELYSDKIDRTGKLAYKRTLALSFKSGGYLKSLKIDEGQQFKQGQLLASLDITELKEEKNANYAKLIQAKREVKRISSLMENKMASERDLDAAITQVETSRAAYQVSYYNLEKAQIYAPFSGIVLARHTELGELQSPGQTALEVAKLEWVVKVALTGQEVSQVRLKQKVDVALNNVGIIEGVISKIPAIANSQSNLFTIEVSLPSLALSSGVIAGQLAGITIAVESNKFVYRLPIEALVTVNEQGKAVVLAQKGKLGEFEQLSFDIFQLGNNYLYLTAEQNDAALNIITKGWQNYSMEKQ